MFVFWTLALNGGLVLAAYGVARWRFHQPAGLPRILAASTLAWSWLVLGTTGLGWLGCLTRPWLLVWIAVAIAIAITSVWISRRHADQTPNSSRTPFLDGTRWDFPAIGGLGLVLWTSVNLGLPSLMLPPKVVSDGPIYHLYFAARWWQASRIHLIAVPFGESAATYFPHGGEVWFAWLYTCWGGARLAQVGQVPFLWLTGAAAYGAARRLGAGGAAALLAVCLFVTSMPLLLFSFEGNVDTLFVAGYLMATYFGLRYALLDGGAGTLALCGLAAGLAWGTKPTGLIFVPILLAVVGMIVLFRTASRSARLGHLGVLGLTTLVGIGPWYGRNFILTGNPLYPLHVEVMGRTIFCGWYTSDAMRFSPFFIPGDELSAFTDIVLAVLDPRLAPIWLLALLGAWGLGRDPEIHRYGRWVWGFAAMAVLQVALYWWLIPYRTQQRFMLHGLGLAVVPVARLLDRAAWLRWATVVGLAVHVLTPQTWPLATESGTVPWDFSDLIPLVTSALVTFPSPAALLHDVLNDAPRVAAHLWNLGWLVLALVAAWSWARVVRQPRLSAYLSAVAVSTILVAMSVAIFLVSLGGRPVLTPHFPDYSRAWLALESRSGPRGLRIAYAGTDIPYYLMGHDLRNEVRYVNVDRHFDWLLHDYHRTAPDRGEPTLWPTPRPGWDRIRPDYQAWRNNLRRDGIAILVVARAKPENGTFNLADPLGFPIERTWAETHPEVFVPLYGVHENDTEMRLYRVRWEAELFP